MKTWSPEAVILAQISNNEKVDMTKRLLAMLELSEMLNNGTLIVEVPGDINDLIDRQTAQRVERESKQEYTWHNGARVKVKV